MEAVWGAALAFLFILATLSGYGAGTPQLEKKDKSEQSEKKDEDKKNEEKKDEEKKGEPEKSDESGKGKSQTKGKSQRNKGSPPKTSKQNAEYCIKDCPEPWRLRP
jgi:hypothetical protein